MGASISEHLHEQQLPAAYRGPRGVILLALKRAGALTTRELSEQLGLSANAIRHHLRELETEGVAAYRREQRGVGAPTYAWHLSPAGEGLFPQRYKELLTEVLDRVAASGVPWQGARDGIGFELDSVRFTLLHPDTAWREWQLDLNEDSAVLLVEYGGFRAIFPGDAGLVAEARLAGRVGPVSVLKVGHHGSRSATGERWLAELQPAVALISSGAGNRYGHPHAEVVARLGRHGVGVWRTDQQGSITVTTDGRRMTVAGRSENVTLPVGSLRAAESARDHHRALHPGPGGEVSGGDR